ncbi:hypothetical protein GGS26DRAFT_323482 [Hypomontagnella submonticulosa]|nr:hypothetical protein GGS26DRAFT_323482 [Hypomontagnella submonticulosa]
MNSNLPPNSVDSRDAPPEPLELTLNRTSDWLRDLDPALSPKQTRSEVNCESITSLSSADMNPSINTNNSSTSEVKHETYRPVILKGANVYLLNDFPGEPTPPYITAITDQILVPPTNVFPDAVWSIRHKKFSEEMSRESRINESGATFALCNFLEIAELTKAQATGLLYKFRGRWQDHHLPTNPKNPRATLSTPEPDITFGFTTNALPEIHDCPYVYSQQYTFYATRACLYFPYFIVEVKAPSQETYVAINQLLTGSSAGIKISERILNGDTLYVFSAFMDGRNAFFYVTWKSGMKFVTWNFKQLLIADYAQFLTCRSIMYNIHLWAVNTRLPVIKAGLATFEAAGQLTSESAVTQQDIDERAKANRPNSTTPVQLDTSDTAMT